jgi:ferrous iron transport protein B
MGVLYGAEGGIATGLDATLAAVLTPSAALAFLVVQMLFVPCVATVAAIKQETRSWGWTAFALGLLLFVSLAGGIAVYHIVSWL